MKRTKSTFLALVVLLSPMAASADVISLQPPGSVLIDIGDSTDIWHGRGFVFEADSDFEMTSLGFDAYWAGLIDFTLNVYDWNSGSRGSELSSSAYTDVSDPGVVPLLDLAHSQDFVAGNRYEVIVQYADSQPGFSRWFAGLDNDSLDSSAGFSVGDYMTVLDGTDYDNGASNSWFVNFSMEVESAQSVPEPGTLALFGIGLAAMGLTRRRKVSA